MATEAEVNYNSGMIAFESKEFNRAMHFLLPFAEQGNADAQHRVSIMLQNGLGLVKNEFHAYKWMKTAAEQGHAVAQHGLGFMYMEGDCVGKNMERAIHWFTLAAEQGLAGSQTTLAMIYDQGNGVEIDQEKARILYQRAGF
ncbi:MAG: sel1 repeat family protein [Gammaproteobacteria bacterium]|nr:sel1 repeat family protein [Gammaproteobacteria bacterium]